MYKYWGVLVKKVLLVLLLTLLFIGLSSLAFSYTYSRAENYDYKQRIPYRYNQYKLKEVEPPYRVRCEWKWVKVTYYETVEYCRVTNWFRPWENPDCREYKIPRYEWKKMWVCG